jgi:hypothetical protein
LKFAKGELAERYPDVAVGELDALVAEGLFLAKDVLAAESVERF